MGPHRSIKTTISLPPLETAADGFARVSDLLPPSDQKITNNLEPSSPWQVQSERPPDKESEPPDPDRSSSAPPEGQQASPKRCESPTKCDSPTTYKQAWQPRMSATTCTPRMSVTTCSPCDADTDIPVSESHTTPLGSFIPASTSGAARASVNTLGSVNALSADSSICPMSMPSSTSLESCYDRGSLTVGQQSTVNAQHEEVPCIFTISDLIYLRSVVAGTAKLHQYAIEGNRAEMRLLLESGTSVNAPILHAGAGGGEEFVTLLHILSSRPDLPENEAVLKEIIEAKANLNARSSLGCTPLSQACLHKHTRATEMLLNSGADTKPVDDRGRNALACAVHLEADKCQEREESLLNVESQSGQLVALLAASRADLNNGGNVPPLLQAIKQENQSAVLALIGHGARPNFLHDAVSHASVNIIKELLESKANPFKDDAQGKSVLEYAFQRGDEEIITLLRDFIGDLERHKSDGAALGGVGDWQMPRKTAEGRGIRSEHSNVQDSQELGGLRGNGQLRPQSSMEADEDNMTLGLSKDVYASKVKHYQSEDSRVAQNKRRSLNNAHVHLKHISNAAQAFPKRHQQTWNFLGNRYAKLQQLCRRVNRDKNFVLVMMAALMMVLFFPDLWIILDVESNAGLDFILVVVFVLFLIELAVQMIGTPKTYINSFFFWMDVVGLCTVPLDHSMVSENMPRSLDNATIMRAARTAKLGARAGRFTKLVKLLRFMPGVVQDMSTGKDPGTARSMSNALMTSLSTRVSCLIIIMVMVLPLFELGTYPENDFSMKTWMVSLDVTLGSNGTTAFTDRLGEFENFYGNKDYHPIETFWTSENGTSMYQRLGGRRPRRLRNLMEISSSSGKLTAVFNFGAQNRIDAWCNMTLLMVIMLLMMGFSLLMSNSVSAIVLRPLEMLLDNVKQTSNKIFTSVAHMEKKCANGRGTDEKGGKTEEVAEASETVLLEKVIEKMAALSAITMKKSPIDAETLEQLGENERGVFQGFAFNRSPSITTQHLTRNTSSGSLDAGDEGDHTAELVSELERCLAEAGLPWHYADSWEFDALNSEERQLHLLCLCFAIFHLGLDYDKSQQKGLSSFIEAAAQAYGSAPYHNFVHAVDVTHCVFRLLNLSGSEHFLSNYERFALVISGISHDVGHPGYNNNFLVETSHELALRYNDHSPLENMHCAKLFEIVAQPKTAIFAHLDKSQYREVRQVCIEAILSTDNIHHFAMIKEIQMLYEMNSDVFDIALQMYQSSQIDFPPSEICDLFADTDRKKLMRNLLLHLSDICNPTKPFEICKKWALLIVDEFFLQGDKEKELNITVQPLNDRDKVNKPHSQIGFIEFFVVPLFFAAVRLFPPMVCCTDQMLLNLQCWYEEWVTTTSPTPSVEEISKVQERIQRLEAKFVFREGF